jgi:hypothetical protein
VIGVVLIAALGVGQEAGEARLTVHPSSVEVGQELVIALEVGHAEGERAALEEGALELDESWIVFASEAPLALPVPGQPGRARTRASWTVASLEPGEREIPAVRYRIGGEGHASPAAQVSVASLLGEGEAQARPPKGFRPLAGEARSPFLWIPWVCAAVALAAAAALAVRARRRRGRVVSAPPGPLERLAELEARPLDDPLEVREAHFELTRAVREALDRRSGRERSGLTDAEWLGEVRGTLAREQALELEALLASCAAVKYGGERPTHWAAREALQRARRLAAENAPAEVAP